MTREMAAVIGDAALRTMHKRKRLLKADRSEDRAERLARFRRIDGQGFARKILLAIVVRLGPFANALKLGVRNRIFEILLLVLEHLRIFRLTEQSHVVENIFGILWHFVTLYCSADGAALLRKERGVMLFRRPKASLSASRPAS